MRTWHKQVGVVAVVALTASVLAASASAPLRSGAATSAPDKIVYAQQTGKNGTYLQYVPGDGSKPTTQAVTGGGGCATPSSSNPVLAFTARYYSGGYGGPSTSAIVGAFNQRTGVCQIPQTWSIEVNEALVFGVGTNALTNGRLFSRVELQLARQDKSTASDAAVQVRLIERAGAVTVGTVNLSIGGPTGNTVTAATPAGGPGFDSLEIQVVGPATGSISVVGPTSTFTLGSKICVGETITASSTDGSVNASATYTGNTVNPAACKSYTDFSAANGATKDVNFGTAATTGARMTMHVDWGTTAFCTPQTCQPTMVDFNDGNGEQAQTFCATASPPATPAWCTTGQRFSYETDPVTHLTVTRVVEDWSGFGDPHLARR